MRHAYHDTELPPLCLKLIFNTLHSLPVLVVQQGTEALTQFEDIVRPLFVKVHSHRSV